MPALPLDEAGPYVAAAYLTFLLLVLVYVGIMAGKLGRIEREIAELHELLDGEERAAATPAAAPEPVAAGASPVKEPTA